MYARWTRCFVNNTTQIGAYSATYFVTRKGIVFEYDAEPFTEIVMAAFPTGADFGILNFFTTMPDPPTFNR